MVTPKDKDELTNDSPPLCDYEGSGYRTDFWEGHGRDYEDLTERGALRRLLPLRGRRVVHLGAGFGRMTNELGGYDPYSSSKACSELLTDSYYHKLSNDHN